MPLNHDILSKAATEARGLAIDAVHACSSGHLGLPLGAAEIGATLFGKALRYFPEDPRWLNRDRFVLSAGHGSMFLYAWLHISGYDLSIEEIKNFRKMGSKTPGHPEFNETPGVESTTGPLGQGVGNAVGMAVSAKMAAAMFNTPEHPIFSQKIVCLAGDGCLQEGVAAEASAYAGHFGLDNLILIYDSNDVTLDAMADASQSEDTAKRYEAYGFHVITVDGHDFDAIEKAYQEASNISGKPTLIVAKTLIGKGIPEVEGTSKGHGEGGAKFAEAARKGLGLPASTFYVSDEVKEAFKNRKDELRKEWEAWQEMFREWKANNPEKAAALDAAINKELPGDLLDQIPTFSPDDKLATRKAGSTVLQPLAKAIPTLISGSADLHGSTLNVIKDSEDFTRDNPGGRNMRFGIREHGMGAIMNGLAYDGIFRSSGATFLTFSDYMRGSIRLAALSHLPVFYIFTHDSVGVGEDGPTHQPVEVTSALRLIPNLDVVRPADPEETAGAFYAALERKDGPTALILTRQAVPTLNGIPVEDRRKGVLSGGYIAKKESGELKGIIMASGSELSVALETAEALGDGYRVVSLPSFERFERQSEVYRNEVLPPECTRRVSIEAGVTGLWGQYVGLHGLAIGIDRFGISAPGGEVMKSLGIHRDNVLREMEKKWND